jgi:HK97 family phage prohead protease
MPEKYSHIDFTPPEGVRKEAEKGLAWRREHGRGGTAVGIARARDLANGVKLSPSTVRRMKAFFDRHQQNKDATGWAPGEDGFPSNARIAWALWGSDAGWAYARKVVEQMNAADEEEGRSLRPFGSTQGIKPKVFVVHGAPASGKTSYVMQHKGENDAIFDFNKVMAAVSGMPPHQKNKNLISYCTDIRDLIIKKALNKPSVDKTWIITTNISDDMKGQLSDIPVEYIHIDTPKEECLKRIEEDQERQPIADELREVVERYFSPEQRSAPVLPNVERRFLGNFSDVEKADPDLLRVEKRADPATGQQQTYLIGYAARFGKDSLLLGDFVERIDPGAFDLVETRQDGEGRPLETRCLFNHDPNHLLGRFPTTMKMTVDEKGLRYECLLPESRKDIEELCRRGDLKGSSFSFVVAEGGEKWSYEGGRSTRLVTKIKSLLDCGPVTYPAYGDATVAVAKRSYQQFQKSGHAESRNKTKAKVAEEFAKTKKFLAERRGFCPTGPGGGIDNSCGTGGAGIHATSTPVMAGAAAGAALGAIAGVPGAVIGSFVGLIAGAVGADRYVAKVEKALKRVGSSVKKIDTFAKSLGKSMQIESTKTGGIKAEGGGMKMTIEKSTGGKIAIVENVKNAIGEKGTESVGRLAETLTGAGRKLGVDHIAVVLSFDDKDQKTFVDAGFKGIEISSDGSNVTLWKSYDKKSKRSLDDLRSFLQERRGFCPTGEGGGIDNSCTATDGSKPQGSGGKQDKPRSGGGGGKQKSPQSGTPKVKPPKEKKESGGYMEWKKGKDKEAQDFVDQAREGQLARGGKSGGKSDDGGGVQTWSKGDDFPWTTKQVGTDKGYVQGQHPDGSKTEKYPFDGDSSEAYKKASDEIAKKKNKRSRDVVRETLAFLKERAR